MISVEISGHRFQVRAAAVFAHDNHILLHRLEQDPFWALPGGRVEPGEDARSTVIREMREELGETIDCSELLYTVENFFDDGQRPNHEIGLYFLAHFRPGSLLLDKSRIHQGIEEGEHLIFRWFPREALPDLEVYPAFLRVSLSQSELTFRHVIQRA